jgi:hypothetical protein
LELLVAPQISAEKSTKPNTLFPTEWTSHIWVICVQIKEKVDLITCVLKYSTDKQNIKKSFWWEKPHQECILTTKKHEHEGILTAKKTREGINKKTHLFGILLKNWRFQLHLFVEGSNYHTQLALLQS